MADFDGDRRLDAACARWPIGPEGGWAADEWAARRRRLTLGPTVLRAETAGVVAASLARLRRRWLGIYPRRARAIGKDEGNT